MATCGAVKVTEQLDFPVGSPLDAKGQELPGLLNVSLPTMEPRVTVPAGVRATPFASVSVTVTVTVIGVAIDTVLVGTENVTTVFVCLVLAVTDAVAVFPVPPLVELTEPDVFV